MTPLRIGLLVAAPMLVVAWATGWVWLFACVAVAAAIAFLNARDWEAYGRDPFDLPSTAPRVSTTSTESIDLGDELADLLRSAEYRARRSLEDTGKLDPFVMYEDAGGNVRVRAVDASDPERTLQRAREAARAVDPTAPRLVLAVPGIAEIDGRPRRAVIYEAAETGFRERTLSFAQEYRRRRLIFPATLVGDPTYVGAAPHTLRFAHRKPHATRGASV